MSTDGGGIALAVAAILFTFRIQPWFGPKTTWKAVLFHVVAERDFRAEGLTIAPLSWLFVSLKSGFLTAALKCYSVG